MDGLDLELRDKIIETHTLLKTVVKSHDEHKSVTNARFRESAKAAEKHQKEVSAIFKEHREDIDAGKEFRTRVITYASVAAGAGAFLIEPIINTIKKIIGFA